MITPQMLNVIAENKISQVANLFSLFFMLINMVWNKNKTARYPGNSEP